MNHDPKPYASTVDDDMPGQAYHCNLDTTAAAIRELERRAAAGQKRWHSIVESCANIGAGFGVAMLANHVLFPLFGWQISARQNFELALCFTVISFVRSYILRRIFNRWHVADARANG